MKNMDVQEFGFDTPDGEYCVFGLNVTIKNGRPVINMFDIEENKDGPKVGDHIWSISQYILDRFFVNQFKRNQVDWTFTSGNRNTDITFDEINNEPIKLRLTDSTAFDWEQSCPLSAAACSEEYFEYNGKPLHKSDTELKLEMRYQATPRDMLVVPCPKAKDGVFHCKPPCFNGNTHDDFEYIMVDTKKLIERIKQDDPEMLEHAYFKFKGETAEDWLENNSSKYPYNTGSFVVGDHIRKKNGLSPGLGITLNSGNAGMLILAQELELPFIPIQIEKHGPNGPNDPEQMKKIRHIQADIGYGFNSGDPRVKSIFQPKL